MGAHAIISRLEASTEPHPHAIISRLETGVTAQRPHAILSRLEVLLPAQRPHAIISRLEVSTAADLTGTVWEMLQHADGSWYAAAVDLRVLDGTGGSWTSLLAPAGTA